MHLNHLVCILPKLLLKKNSISASLFFPFSFFFVRREKTKKGIILKTKLFFFCLSLPPCDVRKLDHVKVGRDKTLGDNKQKVQKLKRMYKVKIFETLKPFLHYLHCTVKISLCTSSFSILDILIYILCRTTITYIIYMTVQYWFVHVLCLTEQHESRQTTPLWPNQHPFEGKMTCY